MEGDVVIKVEEVTGEAGKLLLTSLQRMFCAEFADAITLRMAKTVSDEFLQRYVPDPKFVLTFEEGSGEKIFNLESFDGPTQEALKKIVTIEWPVVKTA